MPGKKPPVKEEPKRIFVKMVFLASLVTAAGLLIWNASIGQRIDLTETASAGNLGLDPDVFVDVDGLQVYVVGRTGGEVPVVLLHDLDVSGSVTMDGLVESAPPAARVLTVDLPGFGLTTRTPEAGPAHTVAAMGRTIASVIEQRLQPPVVIAGVGLGGEVAAEVAATRPDLVRGVLLVDVDFWSQDTWRERSQRLPVLGTAMTFLYETSGYMSLRTWAPHCGDGGWCPTPDQQARRQVTVTIANSTRSINAFRHTPRSSFVPDDLDRIEAPVIYVWSANGAVPDGSVALIANRIEGMELVEVDAFQAHLEQPAVLAQAIARLVDR